MYPSFAPASTNLRPTHDVSGHSRVGGDGVALAVSLADSGHDVCLVATI
jgi:hypothetical protein